MRELVHYEHIASARHKPCKGGYVENAKWDIKTYINASCMRGLVHHEHMASARHEPCKGGMLKVLSWK